MKQFLTINDNGDMLNIDMIAAITPTRNGCTILTKDGREFHSVFNLAKELEDDAEIRSLPRCCRTLLPRRQPDGNQALPAGVSPVRRFS